MSSRSKWKLYYFALFLWYLFLASLVGCEKQLEEQICCDWDATNFDPEYNGHNVNQLYFTNSSLCNDDVCIYENY
jgi:hypothetical protein|tara:strand:+ start:336 stop:560 length:225 start_codon:yes stop_codon:yes gene_type:complete